MGEKNGFKLRFLCLIAKNDTADVSPVDRAVRQKCLRPKSRGDGHNSFRTRFDDVVGDDVAVDDTCPQSAQHGDDRTLAGSNAAGQANM